MGSSTRAANDGEIVVALVDGVETTLKRFAEGVEDTLRAGRMSAGVIGGTMNVMGKAVGMVTDVANAGKSVATEIVGAVSSVTSSKPQAPQAGPAAPSGTPASPSTDTPPSPPPGDQRK